MRVTALVADDERVAREGLRRMLEAHPWLECIGEAANGPAAVKAIDSLRPDLVFLDIQMPGLTGLEVLRRLRHAPLVVFTTAWAQHAVTAFELGALDYLLKPFGAARLEAALVRVRAALGEPVEVPAFDRLAEAMARGPMTRLFVRTARGMLPVPVASVRWFEARGDYVALHAGGDRHLLHLSLNRLESRLDPARFVRVHRTHIVNLDFVREFKKDAGGKAVVELADGTVLPVSRARAGRLSPGG